MLKLIDNQLQKLACGKTQAFFSKGDWQLYHLLQWILNQTGKSTVFISSYSVSEEFLRQINYMKKNELIGACALLIDSRAARKALRLSAFTNNIADEVYLGNNHSKILLVTNDNWKVTVVTSQNQTRGNRYEAGMISTDGETYKKLLAEITLIKKECTNGSELFRRNTGQN